MTKPSNSLTVRGEKTSSKFVAVCLKSFIGFWNIFITLDEIPLINYESQNI